MVLLWTIPEAYKVVCANTQIVPLAIVKSQLVSYNYEITVCVMLLSRDELVSYIDLTADQFSGSQQP